MKYAAYLLLVAGACLTLASKQAAQYFFKEKEEIYETDILKFKIVGFALVLVAAILIFFG